MTCVYPSQAFTHPNPPRHKDGAWTVSCAAKTPQPEKHYVLDVEKAEFLYSEDCRYSLAL